MIKEIQNQTQVIKHLQKETLQTIAPVTGNSVVREGDTVVPPSPPPPPSVLSLSQSPQSATLQKQMILLLTND